MNKKFIYLIAGFVLFSLGQLKAQMYVAQVSKDSLAILSSRIDALKASQKVQELKVDEGKEEVEVEKLRIKMLESTDKAKTSAAKIGKLTQKKIGDQGVDLKETEKMAKRAKNDMEDSQKALERYNKQINKVEKLREKIKSEEQKLGYKKPNIIFGY